MAQLYPKNPAAGQRIQGSAIRVAPLDQAFEAQLSKTCRAADADYIISQQVLANGSTTVVTLVTGQDEVQSLAIGGASAGQFNFKFNGQNYAGGTNAVWYVDVGDSDGGTFTLTFYGQTTATIAWNASPSTGAGSVRAKLEALSTIGTGNVTVTGTGSTVTPFVITFVLDLGSVPVTLTGSGASLTSGGTHVLTLANFTAGVGILYTVTNAQFKTALETLSNIGADEVTVSGSVGGPFTITFAGTLANQGQPLITIPKDVTSGGTGVVVTRTTHGNAQPDVARCACIVANAAGVTGNVVVAGKDLANASITDTIALNGLTPVNGVKAFKSIQTITFPARTHIADTVDVGTTNLLGLHHKLAHNTVLRAFIDNVVEAVAPTVTVSSTVLSQNTAVLATALADDDVVDIHYLV